MVSANFRQAVNASATGECPLLLITIAHALLPQPIRVVNDGVNLTSRGNVFVAYPFQLTLFDDDGEVLPRTQLVIDNVVQDIIVYLRQISTQPAITIEVVLASSPDTVEAGPFNCQLVRGTYDILTIQGDLEYDSVLNEPFTQHSFTPNNFPGLFK